MLKPIYKSWADEHALVAMCKQACGVQIGQTVRNRPGLEDCNKSIQTLAEFTGGKFDDDNGVLLKHAFLSCACILDLDTIYELLQSTRLAIAKRQSTAIGLFACIISGTLHDWRVSIFDGCSPNASPNYFKFASVAYEELKASGLGPVWYDCTVQSKTSTGIYLRKN